MEGVSGWVLLGSYLVFLGKGLFPDLLCLTAKFGFPWFCTEVLTALLAINQHTSATLLA